MSELNELYNIRERADSYYSRFHIILRRIYESQPVASNANLELLAQTIEKAQAVSEATAASVREIKRNWNLS
jgi:ribosomal protein S19E (S16A)